MYCASVISWGNSNTTKVAPRRIRSTRPSLEAMEERTLLTVPIMYANSASVVEHGTGPVTMQFTIDLTSAATQAVTVNYQTSNATAIAGTDYTAASGTLTIPAGQTAGMIPVTVLPDLAATTNKAFYLSLSGASGATLATPKLCGTIDEMPPPSLSIASVQEIVGTSGDTTTMTFTVKLNEPLTYPVTVTASTENLTALAGVNYAANTEVLTFTPGSLTESFVVTIYGSTKVATDSFLVNLTAGSVPIGTAEAAGVIEY
jgi:Calx-beta domain